MNDTPKEIKDLQLKIWLSKPPQDRLRQFMLDNDALFKFWSMAKPIESKISHTITPKKS